MDKVLRIMLLLVALPNSAYGGHWTINETDTQVIVEYEGDANEEIAANSSKEKEEKLKEQDEKEKAKEVERIRVFTENHAKLVETRRTKYKEGYED
jgi:hypothetical protein